MKLASPGYFRFGFILLAIPAIAPPCARGGEGEEGKLARIQFKKGPVELVELISRDDEEIRIRRLFEDTEPRSYKPGEILDIKTDGVPTATDMSRLGQWPLGMARWAEWTICRRGDDPTVAVFPFRSPNGAATPESNRRTEQFVGALANRKVKIVERTRLADLGLEQKLGDAGGYDPEDAKEIGRILRADALLIGTTSPGKKKVEVSVRIVNARTGEIIASGSQLMADQGDSPAGPDISGRWECTGKLPNGSPYKITIHLRPNGKVLGELGIERGSWSAIGQDLTIHYVRENGTEFDISAKLAENNRAFSGRSTNGNSLTIQARKR